MTTRTNKIGKIEADIEKMQKKIAELQRQKKYLQSVDKAMEGKVMRQKYARYCAIAITKLLEIDPKVRGRIDTFLQVLGTNVGLTFNPFNPNETTLRDETFTIEHQK